MLAALKVGAEKWDAVSVQGNAQYLETIVKLAAAHHIKITNPELQERIQQERARLEANRPAREVPQVLTEGQVQAQARTGNGPATSEPHPTHSPEKPAQRPVATHHAPVAPSQTPVETAIALENIRSRVDIEAARETRQAGDATRLRETPATGSAEHPYRSQADAQSARQTSRAIDDNPGKAAPPATIESQKMANIRNDQLSTLEAARANQKLTEAAERANERDDERDRGR